MLLESRTGLLSILNRHFSFKTDDNIDETYGVNVQFESDEEVSCTSIISFTCQC